MTQDNGTVRIAAVGDLHCPRTSAEELHGLFAYVSEQADVLLICGDLTDFGKPDEARQLAQHIAAAGRIPILAVLGNHDYECEQHEELIKVFSGSGMTILDGTATEVRGIGFAGVKGFAGGFGDRALQPWGELALKKFVHEAVEEALKLESALAKLRTPQRIVLCHYAPIPGTIQGEPAEIMPFLGSSRLEEPINRYAVTAVFHGHAHHGTPEGRTRDGVPVYNVALPLLRGRFPDRRPVRILEVPVAAPATVQ
ncbi:MAG TPA: metallophosphoesterase [Nitrospiraceae bacterium]|nr:metallophosphoesterase [Nitrospiraceae bacterium]